MPAARYTEVACKSALNRVQGMPFAWSLNPYRGCRHACAYCYARASHAYLGLDAGRDFEERLFVKVNLPDVLRAELGRPSWRREAVAIGTATDPYQPAEGRYRLTRRCLEVFAQARTPANVTTKGTLVLRDVDVLQELGRAAGCGVSISLITLDHAIWRALEPGTPPPAQRLRALGRLAQAGVPAGLALAPILPRLTDDRRMLEDLVRAAADHGAAWLWSGTLHLEPAARDWLLAALERHFPAAAADYRRVYGGSGDGGGARYTPPAYTQAVGRRLRELQARYGLDDGHRPAPPLGQHAATRAAAPKEPAATQPALPL